MNSNGVAHIVHPGSKMRDVRAGIKQRAKAMCGVFVSKGADHDAPICRGCFEQYRSEGEPPGVEAGDR